jgi:hypothetical protein
MGSELRDYNKKVFIKQFNRVYNQGKKNHFNLQEAEEVGKFNLLYGLNGTAGGADYFKKVMANYDSKKDFTDEDEVQQKSDDSN